jgi:hypothetical protein
MDRFVHRDWVLEALLDIGFVLVRRVREAAIISLLKGASSMIPCVALLAL